VTNLIDLGFILLIIFMIASPLIQQEQTIPINLPSESKSPQAKPDKDVRFVTVSIDGKGFYYMDQRPASMSFGDLKMRLKALAADPKPPVIRIRADAKLPYEKIVQLMDELKKNNLLKFTFDTQAPD